jgi:hypothetical protein
MTTRDSASRRIWVQALALAVLFAGCAAPDRWGAFEGIPSTEDYPVKDGTVGVPQVLHPETYDISFRELPDGKKVFDLSVEQAVMLALRTNRDLQVHRLGPVIAGTFEEFERGVFDPELFAEAEYFREKAKETSRATGEQFSVEGGDTEVIAGIRQDLPSGTTLEATVEQSRSTSDRAPDQQETRVGLGVVQALLRGRGPEVNLARVRQAELEGAASLYELRGYTEALLQRWKRPTGNLCSPTGRSRSSRAPWMSPCSSVSMLRNRSRWDCFPRSMPRRSGPRSPAASRG